MDIWAEATKVAGTQDLEPKSPPADVGFMHRMNAITAL
jgi:hypothetical protein